jgi:hypothetical protein
MADMAAEEIAAPESYAKYANVGGDTPGNQSSGYDPGTDMYFGNDGGLYETPQVDAPDFSSGNANAGTLEPDPGYNTIELTDDSSFTPVKNTESAGMFDFSSVSLSPITIGGVTGFDLSSANLPAGADLSGYTIRSVKGADGTYKNSVVQLPAGDASKGMSRFLSFDPSTGMATYGKPTAGDTTAKQPLYQNAQFMAPVVASIINGLAQNLIADRQAKALRDQQRTALDAQFQVATAKEEASAAQRERFASIYSELRAKRKAGKS